MVILAKVLFPFMIMSGCHFYTVFFAARYSRLRRTSKKLADGKRCPHFSTQLSQECQEGLPLKSDREISCTLGIVVGAFVFCWGPSTLYYFIKMVCPQCYGSAFKQVEQIFKAFVKLLTFANSCLSPLIYCWLNHSLRNACYQSLFGNRQRRKRQFNQFCMKHRGFDPIAIR